MFFGASNGEKTVPPMVNSEDKAMVAEVQAIVHLFAVNLDVPRRESVLLAKAAKAAVGNRHDEGKVVPIVSGWYMKKFRTAFFTFALGLVLCPTTTGTNLATKLLPTVAVAEKAEEYDWCLYVYEWLIGRATTFSQKFDTNGYVAKYGGCILFLLIFYLDHLNHPHLQWDVLPRIKVWEMDDVNKAIEEDKRRSGDYEKLRSVDVAYGERHPQIPRDVAGTYMSNLAVQVFSLFKLHLEKLVGDVVASRGGGVNVIRLVEVI